MLPSMRFEHYQQTSRLPNLDGLRGIAILLVLLHHVPISATHWLSQLQVNGKQGVALFFVISGYIVVTLLLREYRHKAKIDVTGFLIRRTFRLWPLYYAVLALEAGMVAAGLYSDANQQLFSDKLGCYVLYCSNFLESSGQGPFFVSWSLAVEEQFYLFVAVTLLLLPVRFLLFVVAGMLFLKLGLIYFTDQVDETRLLWRVLLGYSEAIIIGVMAAFLLESRAGFDLVRRLKNIPFLVPLAYTGLFAMLLFVQLHHRSEPMTVTFYLLCALTVVLSVTRGPLPVVGGKWLSFVGVISYGIYLLHMPVISGVKKFASDPLLIFIVSLVVVLPMAWASYRFFENPIRKYGSGLSRALGQRSANRYVKKSVETI